MKIKTLLLVLPALCLACGTSSNTDDANDAAGTGSPELARRVVGVQILSTEGYYQEPCHMLGEEYIRGAFGVAEDVAITEGHEEEGCSFEWAGNKVDLSFVGQRPFESIFRAEYEFDVRYQNKPKAAEAPIEKPEPVAMENPEQTATASADAKTDASADGATESDSVSLPTPMAEPAVNTGRFAAVTGLGDKAVWDANTGTMHVLYINHIFSVRVESKDSAATRKDRAESISEAMLEKISEGEYKKFL
ncbi:hypothetical protein [Spirosoma sp. KUDC1026]|uniref:hypothetical protein n=1 Tax=Spirosoma sp. KUDC1026 TaxID=2745947 RepID=UPI00159B90F3|nr:hypothetical protein [Spirosoma sp. KUDC1026]QKZ15086.1 hypothetical protein HU175_21675 [Spirosoma sp. KUDC1026]